MNKRIVTLVVIFIVLAMTLTPVLMNILIGLKG